MEEEFSTIVFNGVAVAVTDLAANIDDGTTVFSIPEDDGIVVVVDNDGDDKSPREF